MRNLRDNIAIVISILTILFTLMTSAFGRETKIETNSVETTNLEKQMDKLDARISGVDSRIYSMNDKIDKQYSTLNDKMDQILMRK